MSAELWKFLAVGWLATVCIETPVLLAALSPVHPFGRRLSAALWINACSYPVVVLVIPQFIDPRTQRGLYLTVAEIFAPLCECAVFYAAFHGVANFGRRVLWRDMAAILAANLLSFGIGELWHRLHA